MIKPDIPIMYSSLNECTREKYLELLTAANASRVWIALDRFTLFNRGDHLEKLKSHICFFEKNSLETGVWIGSLGFGEPMPKGVKRDWTRIKSICGVQTEADSFCPEDNEFVSAYLDWVRDIVKAGARLIMLDDEFCLSVRPGIGCFCDKHIALLEQKVGVLPDNLTDIFTGGKNKYRDAYLEVMGNSMRGFCKKLRVAVDTVDPTVRVGLCAGYTSWDVEGTDPIEMSKLLAGNTKPFFRFTGAPYWVAPTRNRFPGQRLSGVIECAKNQLSWSKDSGIEYFGEADSFPRPSFNCNAMLIENFDIVMQALGVKDLKYLYDYVSSPEYEKQYHKIHVRNMPFYDKLENAFKDTEVCGVRLYRPAHRIADITLPDSFIGEKNVMTKAFFSMAASMLAGQGIPTCYDGDSDYCAVFGDDALCFENNHKRVVVDLPAALILQKKGYDLGIKSISSAPVPFIEHFKDEQVQLVYTSANAEYNALELKPEAKIQSTFDTGAVASFEYNNFLVLNFDALYIGEGSSLLRSYSRGRQLREFFENAYPSICDLSEIYCLLAKKQDGLTVLFQNHSSDPVFDFDINLPKECKEFKLYRAEGVLKGKKIHITTEFSPSASILLEIKY